MTIVCWDAFRDMAAHQERMSRMLLRLCGPPQEVLTRGGWVPAVDIYSDGEHEAGNKGRAAGHEGGGDRTDG